MSLKETDKSFFLLITFSHGLLHVFPSSLSPLLPLIRTEFGLSYTAVGILTLIVTLCWAFSSLPAGILADKINRTKIVILTFLLAGVFSGAMTFASTFLSALLILIFLFLSIGLFHPPVYSCLTYKYPQNKGKIFGIFEMGGSVGILAAPLFAGIISFYLGWRYAFTLLAPPAFVLAFLFYRQLQKDKLKNNEEEHSEIENLKRKTLSHFIPRLRKIYIAHGFFGFTIGGTVSFIPLFLIDVRGFSVSSAGGMLSLFLAGGLVGKIIGGKYSDSRGAGEVIIVGFIITSIFLFLIPFLSGLFLVVLLLLVGVSFFMILPSLFILTGEVKTTDLGLAYGIQLLSGSGSGALSKLFAGLVSDTVGIQYVFFSLSTIALFAGILLLFLLKNEFL